MIGNSTKLIRCHAGVRRAPRVPTANGRSVATLVPNRQSGRPKRVAHFCSSTNDKGVMDSARMSLVTVDEILSKLDIVLEEVIGCEVEFLGAATEATLKVEATSGNWVILSTTEVIKVDHRLAARMLTKNSAYRVAFETIFSQAVESCLGVPNGSVTITGIEDSDMAEKGNLGNATSLVKSALEAGRGNPALAPAAFASGAASGFAGWIGSVVAGRSPGRDQPSVLKVLVVRYAVKIAKESEPSIRANLQAVTAEGTQNLLRAKFKSTFRKGTLGKLNNVLERSDDLLRSLEPRVEPGLQELSQTLLKLNDVLDRSSLILKQVETGVDSGAEDMGEALRRLKIALQRSEDLLKFAEEGMGSMAARMDRTVGSMQLLSAQAVSLMNYVKFALVGIGCSGFAFVYAVLCLVPSPLRHAQVTSDGGPMPGHAEQSE